MAVVAWALLLFLAQLHSFDASSAHGRVNLTHHSAPSSCLPDQASTLLKLKQSFSFDPYSTTTLPSWQAGTDCCLWEGVGCSNSSGHVTALNLGGFNLYIQRFDPLFNLTSLTVLDLSMNHFSDIISVGLERLNLLTHLNFSRTGITGQIPAVFGKLTNLISLDLSCLIDLSDTDEVTISGDPLEYHFHNLVANLTKLRELILDGVYISSRSEDCFKALAKSTPHLRVLSLESCSLTGHIDRSLSRLHHLVKINLSNN
jgi:Leucine-rich repeat (LRR) protein